MSDLNDQQFPLDQNSEMPELDIPSTGFEDLEIQAEVDDSVENTIKGSINYGFVGAGQGGNRIAEAFYQLGFKKTLVINTASQDLAHINIPKEQKLLLSAKMAGAGKDMNVGREALNTSSQDVFNAIRKIMGTNVQHIIVTAGFGGGTGSGTVALLIDICKRYMHSLGFEDAEKRVGAVVSLPMDSELPSAIVKSNTARVLGEIGSMAIKNQISPLVIIDNSKIKAFYRNVPQGKFWSMANGSIASLFSIFNQLSDMPSAYSSFDPRDYATIVNCGGCCIMGVTKIEDLTDKTAFSQALRNNLSKSLLAEGFDLATAKYVGAIVVGPKNVLDEREGLMEMLDYGFASLANIVGNATVHRGIYADNKSNIRVYTIIGGLDVPRGYCRKLNADPKTLFKS